MQTIIEINPIQTNPSVTVSIGVSGWQQHDNIDFQQSFSP